MWNLIEKLLDKLEPDIGAMLFVDLVLIGLLVWKLTTK